MTEVNTFVDKYVLSNFNGKDLDESEAPAPILTLEEQEGKLRVHAKVANVMNGSLSHEKGVLKGLLMSTMRMGNPFQSDVERALSAGFTEGMSASREGPVLLLSHGEDKLKFVVDKRELLRK